LKKLRFFKVFLMEAVIVIWFPFGSQNMVNDAGCSSLAYNQNFFPYIYKMHYMSHHFEGWDRIFLYCPRLSFCKHVK
jgi:hypothetical protein